ncbi:MAG: YlbF family regulator [Ruthenibacterium sp.]
MLKDAVTLFKEAALQLQKEEAYVALAGTRAKNDEDEVLQALIGDFNLARLDLNAELSKAADKNQEKINGLNTKVNQLYNDIMSNESMQAYNEAKSELEAIVNHINAILNTAVNGGDPMTVEAAPAGGCSGSCSSCGGCH